MTRDESLREKFTFIGKLWKSQVWGVWSSLSTYMEKYSYYFGLSLVFLSPEVASIASE